VTPTKGLPSVFSPCMMSPPLLIPKKIMSKRIFLILVSEVNHELAPTLEELEEPLNLSPIPKSKRKKCDHEGVRHF